MTTVQHIATWLGTQVRPERLADRWVADLSIEMIGLGEHSSGHRAVHVTHRGHGETRDAALADLAARLEGTGLVRMTRAGLCGVRGLCVTEAA